MNIDVPVNIFKPSTPTDFAIYHCTLLFSQFTFFPEFHHWKTTNKTHILISVLAQSASLRRIAYRPACIAYMTHYKRVKGPICICCCSFPPFFRCRGKKCSIHIGMMKTRGVRQLALAFPLRLQSNSNNEKKKIDRAYNRVIYSLNFVNFDCLLAIDECVFGCTILAKGVHTGYCVVYAVGIYGW